MNIFEEAQFYLVWRRRMRIACLLATAVGVGVALESWAWFTAALTLALSEIFRD